MCDTIPHAETLQNLEVDLENWGCARTGFTYKRKNENGEKSTNKMVPISAKWMVDESFTTRITAQKLLLNEKITTINESIQLHKTQI